MMQDKRPTEYTAALALPEGRGLTCLVGGGGKTSLLYRLGAEYAARGRAAVVTTTTRIRQPLPAEATLLEEDAFPQLAERIRPGAVWCVCRRGADGKLHFPGRPILERLLDISGRVVAEADGSRGLPCKAPDSHEPCLPPETDAVVAVAGLTALGRPLREICFRWELACPLLGVEPDALLTPALLASLLTDERGQFKHVGSAARYRVFLNQADDARLLALGRETAELVQRALPGCRVVVGALRAPTP